MQIASGKVSELRDGLVEFGTDLFSGLDEKQANDLLQQAGLGEGPVPGVVNAFLYQTPDRTILIDCGGQGLMPGLGGLHAALIAQGIVASDVDTVFLTHIHPDHIGGLMNNGSPAFNNAQVLLHEKELAFWTDPALRSKLPPDFQVFFDAVQKTLQAYEDRISTFSGDEDIAPDVRAVSLPGHTPGHTGLQIGPEEAGLFIWGDIIHAGVFQLAVPEAAIAFDVDASAAVATRQSVLAQAASDRLHIAGGHMFGTGFIDIASNGYVFVADT